MRAAAQADAGDVRLVNVQSAADPDLTPQDFVRAEDLVRDVSEVETFAITQPFPLLFDILERVGALAEPDDFIVYTNADIVLMPYFYRCIRDFIAYRFDALTVNRRIIGNITSFPVGSSFALAEVGSNHPGFDCFIFRRQQLNTYVRSNACLGVPWVGRSLLYNMVARAERMLMLKNVSLTYHYGDDKAWKCSTFDDYSKFNKRQYLTVLKALAADPVAASRLHAFCRHHSEPTAAYEALGVTLLAADEITALVAPDGAFVLVDERWLAPEMLPGRRVIPFLERDGQYWGLPADDETAIRELERLRRAGAGHIVFAWPAFWWLDHYAGFHRYLRARFPCALENERLVAFDLTNATVG
jgi:hypothetical protein